MQPSEFEEEETQEPIVIDAEQASLVFSDVRGPELQAENESSNLD